MGSLLFVGSRDVILLKKKRKKNYIYLRSPSNNKIALVNIISYFNKLMLLSNFYTIGTIKVNYIIFFIEKILSYLWLSSTLFFISSFNLKLAISHRLLL
jgi:hypothetical protein